MSMPPPASPRVRRRPRRKQLENSLAANWCEPFLVITVVGSVLVIGTVHIPVLLGVSAIAFVGGGLAMLGLQRPPKPALVLAALGLFSLLQAIPLPAWWGLRLSPAAAEIWLHSLDPFQEPAPNRFPLSLDGGASVAEALKWFTYAAVYLMAARVRIRRSSAWLAGLLFCSATLVSAITLWHGAANLTAVYDLYEPNFAVGRWNVGPLLNSNNFAGYANLGLFAGIGLLASRSPNLPRPITLVGLGVIGTGLMLSGSRGAMLAAIAGGLITATVFGIKHGITRSLPGVAKAAVPLLIAILAFAAVGTSNEWQAYGGLDVQRKVSAWRWSLTMIGDHPWFGVGRGAFETAFPRYRQALSNDWTVVYSHAENFVVQWLSEWGIPFGGCALIVVVGYVALSWYQTRHERLRFLLLTGVAVLLLQNLADLGLEIPSLMIAAVVALAAGEPTPQKKTESERSTELLEASGAVAVATIAWLCTAAFSSRPVEEERRQATVDYRSLSKANADEQALFKAQLHESVLRHPGEPHFPLLGGIMAFRSGSESPLPWVGRALELGPRDGRVHLLLAEVLAAHRATTQAMLHLRLAVQYDATLGPTVARHLAHWAPSLDILLQGVPQGALGAVFLGSVCEFVERTELRIACYREAVVRVPGDVKLQAQFGEALLRAIRGHLPPCEGENSRSCLDEVDRTARSLSASSPQSWQSGYLTAKSFEAKGDFKSAAALFARVCPPAFEGQQCAQESLAAAIASGSDPAIANAAEIFAARTCVGGEACATAMDWLGSTLDKAGKGAFAITYFTKAAEAESTADRWLRVAQRAVDLRLPGLARPALDRADRTPDATVATRAVTSRLRGEVARTSSLGL